VIIYEEDICAIAHGETIIEDADIENFISLKDDTLWQKSWVGGEIVEFLFLPSATVCDGPYNYELVDRNSDILDTDNINLRYNIDTDEYTLSVYYEPNSDEFYR